MNIEKERADFEAWFTKTKTYISDPKDIFAQIARDIAWEAWQARADLQSQDREDAERLDWIEANHGCDITEFADGTWEVDVPDGPYGAGKGMREAIDNARRIDGGG